MKELVKDYQKNGNGSSNGNGAFNDNGNLLIKNALFVRDKGSLAKVKFSDILWLKGDGNYTTLVTRTKVYSLRNILKEFEAVLPEVDFIRIHKSYIVRVDEINTISPKEVTIVDEKVPVGRTYYQKLINGINKLGSGGQE
ncbi:LytTR family transcriptional regulator [Litoribacter ruber]|uniref:LytTR family transcriptional regulator n=1 Tax=Litoribacter ruber TaxID=702568 RepID=A0AAP2CNX6_9BACT|nr:MULTISPECIES: LytTR family DNA-binding domain-containing protein [Litoribacter]MBS9525207.1 LytTR family transcriptional regulator [Litoribacter alkaliphilus]MBT0811692.1 LytTR family transcriptional regulator [Litoribacter ruber]